MNFRAVSAVTIRLPSNGSTTANSLATSQAAYHAPRRRSTDVLPWDRRRRTSRLPCSRGLRTIRLPWGSPVADLYHPTVPYPQRLHTPPPCPLPPLPPLSTTLSPLYPSMRLQVLILVSLHHQRSTPMWAAY